MRVFLLGATGAIGRPLTHMLLEGGHRVTAVTRSEAKAHALRAAGAEAVVGDALDAEALHRAIVDARPDVVVDELTDIPPDLDVRRYAEQMAGNDRIRRETTPTIVRAAAETGARRVIAQSVAFAYAPQGPRVLSEEAPLDLDASPPWDRSVAALKVLEDAVLETPGVEGVVLRYGFFYGPGTAYAPDGSIAARVRARKFPIVGRGEGVTSFIHVDDAAAATVLALDRGEPGAYNVVDDEPAALREWLPVYADALGAKRPFHVPVWLARIAAGRVGARLAGGRGASNAKARRELGWQPRYPSWRQGFREALD